MKIATHFSANVSLYTPCARYIFWIGKNIAALSELISQTVTYLHAGSHVKPRRVKTRMKMKAGRKGHKKNEHGPAMMIFFFLLCFCDSLLLRTRIYLRRNGVQFKETERRELLNTERKFLLVERHDNNFIWPIYFSSYNQSGLAFKVEAIILQSLKPPFASSLISYWFQFLPF